MLERFDGAAFSRRLPADAKTRTDENHRRHRRIAVPTGTLSMNLIRLLILVAIAYLAWRLYRSLKAPSSPSPPPTPYEPMARCERCGVHLPASALSSTGLCGRCSSP